MSVEELRGAKFVKTLRTFGLLSIPLAYNRNERGVPKQSLKGVPRLSLTAEGAKVLVLFRGIRSLSSDYSLPLDVLEVLLTRGRYSIMRLYGISEGAFPLLVKCSSLAHLTLASPNVKVADEKTWAMLAALPRLTHLELTSESSAAAYDGVKSYFKGSRVDVAVSVSY